MQGYIVNLNRVKDEDLIVNILTDGELKTLYRFYGARHGTINIGFKIDFEIEASSKTTIHRLKDVIHIGYTWINNYELLRDWQSFSALFYKHLKDAQDVGSFYFNLLESAQNQWNKRNPKRIAIESYTQLLQYEGRLHKEHFCFLCSAKIETEFALIRAFLPSHPHCTKTQGISKIAFDELMQNNSSLFLNDKEINILWKTLLEGL